MPLDETYIIYFDLGFTTPYCITILVLWYHKVMLSGWLFMGEGEEGVKNDLQISRLGD